MAHSAKCHRDWKRCAIDQHRYCTSKRKHKIRCVILVQTTQCWISNFRRKIIDENHTDDSCSLHCRNHGWCSVRQGAINIPGADGPLNITSNTIIDLSQAVTGNWNDNNSANAGKGINDATQWAVVFKYSSVTIATGATLTFSNHPSRTTVAWLVSGDATISGTVNLSGSNGGAAPGFAEPGLGGF
jgi:hypothetical protein